MKRLLTTLTVLLAAPLLATAEPALTLPALEGQTHTPLVLQSGKKATVLFFVSPFCSTTKSFMKEINAISTDYADKATLYLVHSDPEVTREVALEHSVLSEVKATVLLDHAQALAQHVHARITPEAVVIGPEGQTLYQGRINDLYLGPTKRQRTATTQDLRTALDAILAGQPVPTPQHEAQGCKIGGIK